MSHADSCSPQQSRGNGPVSPLMLDIDHVKRVNGTYGHQAGGEILRGLSAVIGQFARGVDAVCHCFIRTG